MLTSRGVSGLLKGYGSKLIKWNNGIYTALQLSNHFNYTSQKLTRFIHHRDYLKLAFEKKFIPKGMLKLSPVTIGSQDSNVLNIIREMDYNSGLKLMHFYLEWYPGAISVLRTRLFKLRNILQQRLPRFIMSSMWRRMLIQRYQMSSEIEFRQRKKSSRDFHFNRNFRFNFRIGESVFHSNQSIHISPSSDNYQERFVETIPSLDLSQRSRNSYSSSSDSSFTSCVSTLNQQHLSDDNDDDTSFHTCHSTLDNDSFAGSEGFSDQNVTSQQVKESGYKPEKYFPINLSEDNINQNLQDVCALGRSFVPTNPNINWSQMEEGFNKWALSLRRSAYFEEKGYTSKELNEKEEALNRLEKALVKSKFKPPDSFFNPSLEAFINKVHEDIFNPQNHRKVYHNLPPDQREAIRLFKQDPEHIIGQQDKGGKFTYNRRETYKSNIEATIGNVDKFTTLDEDPTDEYKQRIENWVQRYLGLGDLTQKLADALVPDQAAPGAIYGLDKTHKTPPTIRTITSGCGTVIEKLSAFVALNLQPMAENLPHVIRDSNQFLKALEIIKSKGPLSEGCFLVTIDVVDMFASLNSSDGLKITKSFLNKRKLKVPSTNCILEALRICLESNCSQFGDIFVKQHKGAATGPRYVCDYADLAMSSFDKLIFEYNPSLLVSYSRYRDDCFLIWEGNEESLETFLSFLNSVKPEIKFTMKFSNSQIEYLDILVYIKDGILETTVYSKPTDDHVYLHPRSNHPRHQIRAIPRGQAIRLKRIISNENDLFKAFSDYKQHFIDRGYDESLVKESFDSVFNLDRLALLENVGQNKELGTAGRVYPLVIEHNPRLPSINNIIKSNLNILHSDQTLKNLFPKESLFWAAKRGKNLKEILSPSRFKIEIPNSQQVGCFSNNCGKNCNLCSFLVTTNFIQSFVTKETFPIKDFVHCESKNVIYCINDIYCNLQNVGSTVDMKTRFRNYKSHIKAGKTNCNLYRHWNCDRINHPSTHPVPPNQSSYDRLLRRELQIIILETVNISPSASKEEILRKLEMREGFWQIRLRSEVPYGLNVKDDFRLSF